MITAAFYTDTGSYAEEAEILRASLDAVGMDHDIHEAPDEGDWHANTAQKPLFIAKMREVHSGPLLYIDVDAFVHENCADYFDRLGREGYDFGAHWYAGPPKGDDRSRCCGCLDGGGCTREHRLLSGTLFFGDTDGARRILETWIAGNAFWRQRGVMDGGGQKQLWWTVTRMSESIKVKRLPGRFTWAFDREWAYPDEEYPVIEHTLASREHRGPSLGKTHQGRQKRIQQLRELVRASNAA